MNAKKFCFIICVKREDYLKECIFYLEQLRVPEGYSMQIQPIRRATSMAGAYNMAMQASDAKYKIYLHQDCFVINPNFLYDLLMIFENDKKIGMVGMVGSPQTPPDLLPWHGVRIGNGYSWDVENTDYKDYSYKLTDGIKDVESIDGMLMATAFDLPWREDLFDGWDLYDISQSFEFRKAGYRVVVPEQTKPWVAHDSENVSLQGYDKYRLIALEEYKDML